MSPAVLTETVSALVKEDPPVLPGRVIAARNRAADASAELPDLRR